MLVQWLSPNVVEALMIPLLFALCAASGLAMLSRSGIGRSIDALERWTLFSLVGFTAISLVGTAWAFVGLFKQWTVVPSLALLLWGVRRLMPTSETAAQPHGPTTPVFVQIIAAIVLVAAAWLYAKPAESVLLTDDSAVYTIGGIVLARDGTLYYRPDEVSAFEPLDETGTWAALHHLYQFSYPQTYAPVVTRHPGPFYRYPSGPSARIEIGFLALPKVWAALCVWAGSAPAATCAVPFLAVLGLALFYVYVKQALGWPSALAGMLVLGASFSQFWFARFPLSEMHTQVVVLGAVSAVALARRAGDKGHAQALATLAGLLLGLLGCLRFESPLLMALLLPLIWIDLDQNAGSSGVGRTFVISAAVAWLLCLTGSAMTAPFYMLTRSINLMSPTVIRVLALGLTTCVALAALARWKLGGLHAVRDQALSLAPRLISRAVGIGMALWLLHALTVSVGIDERDSVVGWLIAYWGALPMAMAALSAAACSRALICHRARTRQISLIGLATAFLLVYSLYPMVTISHPWAIRRTVAFIGPALACGVASIPFWLPSVGAPISHRHPWIRQVLRGFAWVAVATAMLLVAKRSAPFVQHRERDGSLDALEKIVQALPKDSILLLEDGLRARQFGPYLELVLGYPTYPLRTTEAHAQNPPVVDSLIESARDNGTAVCFLHDDGSAPWTLQDWQLTSREGVQARITTVGNSTKMPPTGDDIVTHEILLDLYDVTRADATNLWDARESIGIPSGPGSYPYLEHGFHKIEMRDGEPYRWTSSEADIALPWPSDDQVVSDVCVALDILPWRPEGVAPASITVRIEDQIAYWGTADPTSERHTLLVSSHDVVHDGDGELDIVIETNPWQSANEVAQSGAARDLGILFFGARVSLDGPCLLGCDGAYAQEVDAAGEAFQWTSDQATLAYSWPGDAGEPLGTVVLDLGIYYPAQADPITLRIDVEGQTVQTKTLGTADGRIALDLPTTGITNRGPETLDVVIRSSTWSPAEFGASTDARELGVMFYGVDHVK